MFDNSTEVLSALEKAVVETFETMAFEEVISKDVRTELPDWSADAIWTSIKIMNPADMKLYFVVSKEHALNMVQIVSDSEDEEEWNKLVLDLTAEYINTIAGRFGNFMLDEGERVMVGLPEQVIFDEDFKKEFQSHVISIISFAVEEQEVLCCIAKN